MSVGNNKIYTFVTILVLISFLLAGCSKKEVYYFKSECPVSGSAKNLAVGWSEYYLYMYFMDEGGNFITDKFVAFQHGKPGGLAKESQVYDDYFMIDVIPFNPSGYFVAQGSYKFGSSVLPAQIPANKPAPGTNQRLYYPCPDAYGSENITIFIINGQQTTNLAGLWWINNRITINVLEDGSIELPRTGIRACDDDSNWWVSDNVGDKILMVKE
jgi:hypothetical protein